MWPISLIVCKAILLSSEPEASLVASSPNVPFYFPCKMQAVELYLCMAVSLVYKMWGNNTLCQAEGGHLGGVRALKRCCITLTIPASPRCRKAGCLCAPVHQDTKNIQRLSLGKRSGRGSFQGTSYCFYFCKGISTIECANIVSLKCQGMEGVGVVFLIDAVH